MDYPRDVKKKKYNPLTACPSAHWEDYLMMAMGACTEAFERLPLVQDKEILDNILYSGVWSNVRREKREGT